MHKKFRSCFCTLSIAIILVFSCSSFAVSTSHVGVISTVNNGVPVKIYTGGAQLTYEEKMSLHMQEPRVYVGHTVEDTITSNAESSSNARNETFIWGDWSYPDGFTVSLEIGGSQSGMWLGTGDWDKAILHQSTTVSMAGVGSYDISWPPSVSISGDEKSASWDSDPVTTGWKLTADRMNAVFSISGLAVILDGFSITDTSDIYIGSHIYRPTGYGSYSV